MKNYLTVPLEVKSLNERELSGYGSIFGNVDRGGERVVPGAFKSSLERHMDEGQMPQMFWMHQPDKVPGMWTEMKEDKNGLYVKGVFADTELGNEIRTLTRMKAVRGLSIGYEEVTVGYERGVKLLKELNLWEVSPVSLAMNPLAQIEYVKSRLSRDGEYVPTARELERLLRDVGCSKKVACTMIAKFFDDEGSGILTPRQWDTDDEDPRDDELTAEEAEGVKVFGDLAAKMAIGLLSR